MSASRHEVVGREYWTEAEALAAAREQSATARPGRRRHESQRRGAILARTIETEVIPRLVLARGGAPRVVAVPAPESEPHLVAGITHVTTLAGLVLTTDMPDAGGYVDGLRRQGASTESLCLDLLAPTARRLGEMWEQDLCDFTEVTIGLWRLQQVLRDLGNLAHDETQGQRPGPRALMVPVTGEQHTFGLAMVVDFFRNAHWNVWSGVVASNTELASLVRRESFAVIGISVACGDRLEAVADCVRVVRRASCNPAIGIMVGGPVFIEHPELAAQVGADATATDGRQAVLQAEALLTLLPAQI